MKKNNSGFTLVELSIVIVISSFIALAFFKAYQIYLEKVAITQTEESIDRVEAALANYLRTNMRYPCPANPYDNKNDDPATYGREPPECLAGNMTLASLGTDMPWFANPIGIDTDTDPILGRDANQDGDFANDFVFYGAVPFRTLEPCFDTPQASQCQRPLTLEESDIYDAWGNQITYVVTADLTVGFTTSPPFNNSFGAIQVEDEHKQSVIDPPGSAHYALISHGPDRYGAFNNEGNPIDNDCSPDVFVLSTGGPPPPVGTTPAFWGQRQNCDHNDSLVVKALKSDNPNFYYDDIVSFHISNLAILWRATGLNEMVNNNQGFVGVGDFFFNSPLDNNLPTSELHIQGDMRAVEIYADRICDASGSQCFVPEFLGGPVVDTPPLGTGMPDDFQNTCSDPDEVIIEIRDNRVICARPFASGIIPGSCPVGQVMTGYQSDIGIICGTF